MPKRRKPSPIKKILGATFYVLFCAACLAAGTGAGLVGQGKVTSEFLSQVVHRTSPQEVFSGKNSLTMLVLGCDEDVAYGGASVLRHQARSDMMLVAKLDFSNNKISGVAIPRDLLVQVPGYRRQKINAYHAMGGKPLAQQAVEQVLGLSIDRTVTIDFNALQQMVDMVGGVEVFVPKKMDYDDNRANPPLHIHFKPGKQIMNGYQAMCFVRFRHSDDDFHRQERQKDFMMAFKDSVSRHPSLLPRVADKSMAVLGGGFNEKEMAAVALFAKGVGGDNIKIGQIPVLPVDKYNYDVDEDKLPDCLRQYNLIEGARVSYRQ